MPDARGRIRNSGARLAVLAATSMLPALDGQDAIRFLDVSSDSGLEFVLANHPTPEKHLPETMAGGVAALDYDGDGRIDIFFANGAALPKLVKEGPADWNRLYRNLGGMQFADVTEAAGLQGRGFCTGASAADYDNDGDADLFVACVAGGSLYRNEGNGTFQDVTREAGIEGSPWPIAGVWLDFDVDGLLDLFLVNYLQWSAAFDTFCGDRLGNVRSYCDPTLFDGLANQLYRNRGDGVFRDVSEEAGIARHIGKGMSAAVADYDDDGDIDIFVTNDKEANFLFENLGNGTFDEVALFAGAALRDHGKAVSAMGVDFNDYDNDGRPDLAFTALAGESFPLFRNSGDGEFRDETFRSGLSKLARELSGWSIGLVDFDNDGWKDLFTANSHVNDTVEHFDAVRYELENTVFWNARNGTFEKAPGGSLEAARVYRGSAFADFDSDGRVDVVVTALGGRAELLKNGSGGGNRWIALDLVGTSSNRDGLGATVRIESQFNHASSSVGYASSSHGPVHFGLGTVEIVDKVRVSWPNGTKQTLSNVQTNRVLRVLEP